MMYFCFIVSGELYTFNCLFSTFSDIFKYFLIALILYECNCAYNKINIFILIIKFHKNILISNS